jgi:hypothetical protein
LVKKNKNVIMALQGDITWTFVEYSDTETEDMVITHPDGSEETVQQPKQILRTESWSDVYVYVKSIQVHTITHDNTKVEQVLYHYAGYESKEARDADNENFLFFDGGVLFNHDHNLNLWSQCYNNIKEKDNFKDLQNC